MSRIIPHDYQVTAIRNTKGYLIAGRKRVLIVAPTGAGKTTIAAEIITGAVDKARRVLFIAHRKELIDQASARLDRYGLDHGIIKAGTKRAKPRALVQVASIQTLTRRELPPADIIIIDEAHRSKSKSYMDVLAAYPHAVTLGLTATPWRLDGSGLGDLFQELVLVCQPGYLIDRDPAVLVKPRVFAPATPDLKGMKSSKGDYEQAALQALMSTEASVDEIVLNWQRHAAGRATVAFATGINHSLMIRDAFRAIGVAAEHIDGNTGNDERERILKNLDEGRVQLVSNCEVLTEGWDCPRVACAILARPTKSLSLYLQMVGRVLRATAGKADAIVLDHAGNHAEHGFATDDREWNLQGKKKQPKVAGIKNCPECFACCPSLCRTCPECGEEFMINESSDGDGKAQVTRELVEVLPGASLLPPLERRDRWLEAYRVTGRAMTQAEKQALYDVLAAECLSKGRKTGWVYHKYKLVTGKGPSGRLRAESPHAEALLAKKAREQMQSYGLSESEATA